MENSDKYRIGLMVVVYAITIVSCLLGVFAVYNLIAVQKPWTIGVSYADVLEYSEDKPAIIDVKIHGNENDNGQALYELQFNSYTDSDGNGISGFGIQCVGGWEIRQDRQTLPNYKNTEKLFGGLNADLQNSNRKDVIGENEKFLNQYETYAVGDFYLYYTGDHGVTYSYLPVEELDDYLLIDIDGKFYKLTLNTYTYTTQEGYSGFTGFFKNFWSAKTVTHTVKYSWFDVFNAVMQSAFRDSAKEEFRKYALPLMDLSEYLTIEYKDDDGKYHPVDKTTENRHYFSIPVEYYKDGATEVADAKFKMVGCSTTWSYYNDTNVVDYWNAQPVITIDESQLNYIYYKSYDKYFLTIDKEYANYLKIVSDPKNLYNRKININLNIANKTKYEIAGIDLQNFDFEINTFEITGASEDFKILNENMCSLKPTLKGV